MGPIILTAIETGMRRGEIVNIWRANLDLDQRTLHLPITKNGHPRTIPLSTKAVDIIRNVPRTDERVFPITANALRLAWEKLRRRAGITNLHFHDLRHEAISRFFERGLSVPEVALISGHRDYRMLFRYTYLRAEDVAKKLI
jgi:integrase